MVVITRVGYCTECAKAHEPTGGHMFLAFGTSSNCFKAMTAEYSGRFGFTPHIYKGKLNGNKITVDIACAMYGCGAEKYIQNGQEYLNIKQGAWRRETWPIERWNALVLYNHDKQFEI